MKQKAAIIHKDGAILRLIDLAERLEIGCIHESFPPQVIKAYIESVKNMGFTIINLKSFG